MYHTGHKFSSQSKLQNNRNPRLSISPEILSPMRKLNGKCTRSRAVCGILVTGTNDIDQWLMPLLLISFCNLCGRVSDSSKIKILPSNR